MYAQAYCAQSGPSSMPSPSTVSQREPFHQVDSFQQCPVVKTTLSECVKGAPDQNASNSSNQCRQNHNCDFKLNAVEDQGQISPATDRGASTSHGNGGPLSHLHSMDCASISCSSGNVSQVMVTRHAGESRPIEETSPPFVSLSPVAYVVLQGKIALY
ncbi:hypothetical protein SAY87_030460 [Trapa incisa]|uniref:Uncharacterized protein n=1 Tax=Trapa incisa TaxID=236973 RepID=A0AAN7KT53_9MYRT|nr:hypothetical protein SAY87_030460 [Trapa incisa]